MYLFKGLASEYSLYRQDGWHSRRSRPGKTKAATAARTSERPRRRATPENASDEAGSVPAGGEEGGEGNETRRGRISTF